MQRRGGSGGGSHRVQSFRGGYDNGAYVGPNTNQHQHRHNSSSNQSVSRFGGGGGGGGGRGGGGGGGSSSKGYRHIGSGGPYDQPPQQQRPVYMMHGGGGNIGGGGSGNGGAGGSGGGSGGSFSEDPYVTSMIRTVAECYTVDKVSLGGGEYGDVYGAVDKKNGQEVAIKFMRERDNTKLPQETRREIAILCSAALRHPNIVSLIEVVRENSAFTEGGKPRSRGLYCIVMERAPYTLRALVKHGFHFTEWEFKSITWQILDGVRHMHKLKILHRDLKTDNVLITENGIVKIADFGLAKNMSHDQHAKLSKKVTINYRPFEHFLRGPYCGEQADVWSIGCIMAELLTRGLFIRGQTELDVLYHLCKIVGTPTAQNCPGFEKWLGLPGGANLPVFPSRLLAHLAEKLEHLEEKLECGNTSGGGGSGGGGGGIGPSHLTPALQNLFSHMLELNPLYRFKAQRALEHAYYRHDPKMPDKKLERRISLDGHGGGAGGASSHALMNTKIGERTLSSSLSSSSLLSRGGVPPRDEAMKQAPHEATMNAPHEGPQAYKHVTSGPSIPSKTVSSRAEADHPTRFTPVRKPDREPMVSSSSSMSGSKPAAPLSSVSSALTASAPSGTQTRQEKEKEEESGKALLKQRGTDEEENDSEAEEGEVIPEEGEVIPVHVNDRKSTQAVSTCASAPAVTSASLSLVKASTVNLPYSTSSSTSTSSSKLPVGSGSMVPSSSPSASLLAFAGKREREDGEKEVKDGEQRAQGAGQQGAAGGGNSNSDGEESEALGVQLMHKSGQASPVCAESLSSTSVSPVMKASTANRSTSTSNSKCEPVASPSASLPASAASGKRKWEEVEEDGKGAKAAGQQGAACGGDSKGDGAEGEANLMHPLPAKTSPEMEPPTVSLSTSTSSLYSGLGPGRAPGTGSAATAPLASTVSAAAATGAELIPEEYATSAPRAKTLTQRTRRQCRGESANIEVEGEGVNAEDGSLSQWEMRKMAGGEEHGVTGVSEY